MATAKLVIKRKYVKISGLTPVYIQYIFKAENKFLINTGIEVFPRLWNSQTQSIKNYDGYIFNEKNYATINAELSLLISKFKQFLSSVIAKNQIPTIKFVRDHFPQYLKNEGNNHKHIPAKLVNLYDHFKDYIESKEEDVAVDTVKDYRSLQKHLKAYEKSRACHLDFTSFDYAFYEDFVDFLFYETRKPNGECGLLSNSVGKQIKNLKCFLRNRIRKGYCANIDLSGFITLSEEVDKIFLSWEEISQIYKFDLSKHQHLNDTRNLLVLGCLIGLRFSDLSRISPSHIQNNILKIRQKKVQKFVQIPIMNEVYDILKQYNFHSPNLQLNEFNNQLKELGMLLGYNEKVEVTHYKKGKPVIEYKMKYELLTSHICRRSFCTNEYLRGTDPLLIRKISGHRTEKAFLTYLKIDEFVAAQKIAQSWVNRTLA